MNNSVASRGHGVTRLSAIAFGLALVAALCVIAAPLLYRMTPVGLGALLLFPVALLLGLVALILVVVRFFMARSRGVHTGGSLAVATLVIVFAGLAIPVGMLASSMMSGAPAIHDVTTDTDDPPSFVAVLPLRGANSNSTEPKRETAVAQKRAFPDIAPLVVDKSMDALFAQALATAKSLGWEIVAAVPEEGRIEATDTTRFMGFKDDVVIRIRPEGAGSRLDIRSLSRIGGGDLGQNAKRIRAFMAGMKEP